MAARISEYYENDLNDQDFSIKLLRNRNRMFLIVFEASYIALTF